MKRWFAGLLVLLLLMGTLSACGSDKSADRSFFYPLTAEPKSLDPQICGDKDTAMVVGSLYEGLVRMGADGTIRPGVAERMEVSDDGLTYTFYLRADAKWHIIKNFKNIYGEGCEKNLEMPVTAQDFVFAFQRIFMASTNTPGVDTLYAIRNAREIHDGEVTLLELGVKALDAKTLVITLARPSADFLTMLCQPICAPCNRFFFESTKGKYGLGLAYTMCNGPFYLSKWNETSNLFLRRNPDYVGEQAVIPAGLYFYINGDESTYPAKINEGAYDAAPIAEEYIGDLSDDAKTVQIADTVWGLAFNCQDETVSNAYLRMALCSAFSAETLEMPEKTTARGMLPSACRISGLCYRDETGDVPKMEYSKDRALLFMQFALEALETSHINLEILCTEEYELAMRRVIQSWQKVFGVTVAASTVVCTQEELRTAREEGAYQVAFLPVKAPSTSAVQTLYSYTSEDGSLFGMEDEEFAGYMRTLQCAPSASSAVEACRQAESYLIRTGVFYPVFEDTSCFAFYAQTDGITVTPCGEMISFVQARKYD